MHTTTAAELAGVSFRQLDYWISVGYLTADGSEQGPGRPRDIDADEVEVLRFMALLVRHGLTPAVAVEVARQLQTTGRARLGLFVITTAVPNLTTSTGDTAA